MRQRQAEFTIRIFGVTLFRALLFLGAGWSWPYVALRPWMVGIYLHCGQGLYIQFGHSRMFDRKVKRAIKAMTPQERERLREILGEALRSNSNHS